MSRVLHLADLVWCHVCAGVLKKFQAMGVMAKDNWNDKLPDIQ